jgi:peroxiredoxin
LPSAIEQVQREFGERGLAVLALSIQEPRERVAAWASDHPTTFTVLLDTEGRVTRRYEVTATPTVFIISRDGRLVGKALGTKDWTSERGRALLTALTGT